MVLEPHMPSSSESISIFVTYALIQLSVVFALVHEIIYTPYDRLHPLHFCVLKVSDNRSYT